MGHYICLGGCHGVSEVPNVCGTGACTNEGKDMKMCDCDDGKHGGAFDVDNDSEGSATESTEKM